MTVKQFINFGEFSGGILDYIQISAKGAVEYIIYLIHISTFQPKTRKERGEKPSIRWN